MDGVLVQWPFRSSRSWSRPVTVLRDEGLDPSEGVDGSSESDSSSPLSSSESEEGGDQGTDE